MYEVEYRYSDEKVAQHLYCTQIHFKTSLNVLNVLTDDKEWINLDLGKCEELDIHKVDLKDI